MNNIMKIRKTRNFTRKHLCKLVGISEIYLYKIEYEKRQPGIDIVKKLANALNVTIDEMYPREKELTKEEQFQQILDKVEVNGKRGSKRVSKS